MKMNILRPVLFAFFDEIENFGGRTIIVNDRHKTIQLYFSSGLENGTITLLKKLVCKESFSKNREPIP